MARQITKELAERIVAKLRARRSPDVRRGSPHDLYDFEFDGVLVLQLSVRRGSAKDLGHDHMPKELRLGPGQAKRLGQCPLSLDEYVAILRDKGVIGPEPPAGEPA